MKILCLSLCLHAQSRVGVSGAEKNAATLGVIEGFGLLSEQAHQYCSLAQVRVRGCVMQQSSAGALAEKAHWNMC